ncbi:hypothetical protein [Parasulfitobacter algicola]|uniref:Uncharacterized protein n=1 Tax=Parasulfitobacter algicola TaxID=2614809 RepID=A0ABX2IUA9_9RHOB|nr:hypothetical protein [Sulfitobacter algicola]NSX56145.1 hypothetical protein [Sulfitobacter algicola]
MTEILELIIGRIVVCIYGTEKNPRHPIWRNITRTIAFGGAAVAMINILYFSAEIEIPTAIIVVWMLCFLTVFTAELYVGSYIMLATSCVFGLLLFGTLLISV